MDIPQVSFAKGEVSPIAAARTDQAFYANALTTCLNFYVRAEGAVSNRPGLQYIGTCQSATPNGSYLIPFVYSNGQSYITEWAAGQTAVYSNGAQIANASGATISNVTYNYVLLHPGGLSQFNFTTATPHGFTNGEQVTISGVVYTNTPASSLTPNGLWSVVVTGPSTFTVFPPFAITTFTYTSGGSATGGNTVNNPYSITDLPNLRWAQSADTLEVVVQTQPPQQFKRLSPTLFNLAPAGIVNGPFQDVNTDGITTVYASATQGTVTLTASTPLFSASHIGTPFYLEEQFLENVQPWEANKILNLLSPTAVGMYCRSNGKIYVCVAQSQAYAYAASGQYQPVHTSGTVWDGNGMNNPAIVNVGYGVGWQYVSSNAGVAKITSMVGSPNGAGLYTQCTAVVESYSGVYSNFPPTVVGGPSSLSPGPWTVSGTGSLGSFTITGATNLDPNAYYVTVGGIFQDPSTYTLTTQLITFYTPPVAGTNNVVIKYTGHTLANGSVVGAMNLSTYWAFGSLSTLQGYPSTVCWFDDRLTYAGTLLQPQSVWASQVSQYLNFGVSDPQIDSDAITFTINARRENPIVDMMPLNDLIIGTASNMWRVTHSANVGAITPSDISLMPQNYYGQQPVPSVQTGDTMIYVQWGGRKIRDLVYQFQYDKFVGTELTVFARQMFPNGTTATRMAFAPEPYGLLYVVRSDGVLCVCSYLPEQQINAWARWTTEGFFEDVCVVPENGTYATYVIVRRVIGGQTVRYIERFAPREFQTPQDAFFVDSGLTYDGRNTSTTTLTLSGGTTWGSGDVGTLTASSSSGWSGFNSADVSFGNQIWLTDGNNNLVVLLQITNVISTTVAQVSFIINVPVAYQNTATVNWTFAKSVFQGATNLIGASVVAQADTATGAAVSIGSSGQVNVSQPVGVLHIGLPYNCQLQSMNLNVQGQQTIRNIAKTVNRVSVVLDTSGPVQVGPDFNNMATMPISQFAYPFGQNNPVAPGGSTLASIVEWQSGAQPCFVPTGNLPGGTDTADEAYVCLQSSIPQPVTVLSWIADTNIGDSQ